MSTKKPASNALRRRELRKNLARLPKDAEIVVICRTSVRAYQAQRILAGVGYQNVAFVEGSMQGWLYEVCTLPTMKA